MVMGLWGPAGLGVRWVFPGWLGRLTGRLQRLGTWGACLLVRGQRAGCGWCGCSGVSLLARGRPVGRVCLDVVPGRIPARAGHPVGLGGTTVSTGGSIPAGAGFGLMWALKIDRVVHHSVILEFDVPSYRTNAAQQRVQAEEVNRQK